ncbi:MAG: 3-isopropylmalate dehydratase [Alphaproteobacteria bacterium]|nr:3-isopropylmalate dehydratase [Alphaproteobacteria bacterium]
MIPNWLVAGRYMDPKDLVPHLFEELRPGFHEKAKPGDVIVAGRNFGMGPKMNGYIAMQALGLGLLTESMPFLGYRAALGCGLRVLDRCPGVLDLVEDGDEVEVDFSTGAFANRSRGTGRTFEPVPEALRDLVELGGTSGFLRRWREANQPKDTSGRQTAAAAHR